MNTTTRPLSRTGIWFGVAIAAAAAVGVFLWNDGDAPNPAATIRFGVILPLTGDAAQYGKNDREGIDLAVSLVNDAGGILGRKVEVMYEDCQTDAKMALAAFTKLRAGGVSLFIDDAISTISLATAPLLEQNKSVLISTGASNPALSGISPWFFRIWNSDALEGRVAADLLKSTAPTARVAILYVNSDYGQGLQRVFAEALRGTHVEVVSTEPFEKDARDFRSQIAKVRAAAPTHIYLVGYAAQTGPATRQFREAGVSAQIIGTVAMEDANYLELAGASANGVVYPFPKAPEGEAVLRFKEGFRAKYGKEPELLHDCGYDAAGLLIEASRNGAQTAADVRAFLSSLRNFPGASGEISFDANGDVSKPMEMRTIKDGRFVSLPAAS